MIARGNSLHDWLQRMRGEYREMPDLHLTRSQAQRLWRLDAATCEAAFAALIASGFLRLTPHGRYVRAAE